MGTLAERLSSWRLLAASLTGGILVSIAFRRRKGGNPMAKSASLMRRYDYFRNCYAKHGGALQSADTAMCLAMAEERAADMGLKVTAEEEQESYRDVYGDDPPKGVTFYCLMVCAPDDEHDVLASLGFVDDVDSAYWRCTSAELLSEALSTLDERSDADSTSEANELSGRATFAAGGAVTRKAG
jgi:hypothetical protein